MKTRWLVMVALVVVLAWLAWRQLQSPRPGPETAPPVQVLPERPFEVCGRLVDEEGVPVAGAEVALFGDRATWLDHFAIHERPSDVGRDCARWPMACSSDGARAEVLRRFDAGTLEFPEALGRTKTDAHGRFSLVTNTRDAFVVAWKDWKLALAEDELAPWKDLRLAFDTSARDRVELQPWNPGLVVINPFTRQAKRFAAAEPIDAPAEGSFIFVENEKAPIRVVTFSLRDVDGGMVDGVVDLDCGPDERHVATSDGGVVSVSIIDVPRRNCRYTARARALREDSWVLPGKTEIAPRLRTRPHLTVRWTPAAGAVTEVIVDYPPTGGIGDIGTRGGGRTPGHGLFDGGVATFDPLWVGADVNVLEVHIAKPGFVRARRRVTLDTGREVFISLEPAPGATGAIVDGEGRAVTGLTLHASFLDGGYAGWTSTDWNGRFAMTPDTAEPLLLRAEHPMLGFLDFRTDAHAEVLTLSRAGAVAVTLRQPDGGVLAGEVVSVLAGDGEASVRASDAGEVLLPGLRAGARTIVLRAGDGEQAGVAVDVPPSGLVRSSVTLAEPSP